VAAWDGDLLKFGNLLNEARARYVEGLAREADPIARNLLGGELTLQYRSGWSRDQSFEEALQHSLTQDRLTGHTQVGPHRAELAIRLDGVAVKDRISRGQQKLVAASLLIAQLRLFPEDASVQPSLLLDDPAAELDDERLTGLIAEVASHSVQLVVTTLHREFSAFGTPGRRYSAVEGRVEAL
jgi:DNA replication and repair protein RecF